jgi:hypothetical protein
VQVRVQLDSLFLFALGWGHDIRDSGGGESSGEGERERERAARDSWMVGVVGKLDLARRIFWLEDGKRSGFPRPSAGYRMLLVAVDG